ncbi:MAG: mechanosensitive ion channel family protein [Candidatus Micrarchaeota archaeon]
MTFAFAIPYAEMLAELPGGLPVVFLAMFGILAFIFDVILSVLLKIAKMIVSRTSFTLDDRLLKAIGGFVLPFSILTALWLSFESTYPETIIVEGYTTLDLYVISLIALAGFLLSSIADTVLVWYGVELQPDKRKVKEKEVFPFVRNVVKVAIILIFLVFVLHRLGFETGALITGLGVGGLAVALALQDTLSNFFAGVHILIDKPFKEEDFIKLETGIEGTVKQIGWRTTRLVTPAMNEVIVPNSKLSTSILENYNSPNFLSGVFYVIGVDYKEDIDHVENIINDVLKKTAKSTDLMEEESVWVRFDKFGDFSLDFKFGYRVKGYINRFDVLKQVNRELFYAFKKEGISIPFPVRVVYNQSLPEPKKKK